MNLFGKWFSYVEIFVKILFNFFDTSNFNFCDGSPMDISATMWVIYLFVTGSVWFWKDEDVGLTLKGIFKIGSEYIILIKKGLIKRKKPLTYLYNMENFNYYFYFNI